MISKAKMAWWSSVVGLVVLVACGRTESQSDLSIVGGQKVAETDEVIKSTVALVLPTGEQFCTGSLIAANLVITAAHCLVDYSEKQLFVAFGPVALPGYFKQDHIRAASSFVVSADYNEQQMAIDNPSSPPNDIALVKLSQPAPAGFKPVKVLTAATPLKVGETLVLAGFGLTKWYNESGGVLYKVAMSIGKLSSKAKELDFAAASGKSACMGDSGGPAFVYRDQKLVLTGVTSRGSAFCNATGTYTDLRYYSSWIAKAAVATK